MIVLLLHYRNQQLWTPLDCAAHKGWVKTAYALLENDSTVDPTDKAKVMIFLSCISKNIIDNDYIDFIYTAMSDRIYHPWHFNNQLYKQTKKIDTL